MIVVASLFVAGPQYEASFGDKLHSFKFTYYSSPTPTIYLSQNKKSASRKCTNKHTTSLFITCCVFVHVAVFVLCLRHNGAVLQYCCILCESNGTT